MIIRASEIPTFDTDDGIALRVYLESLRGWLETERSTWDSQYTLLNRFFQPRGARFNYDNTDNGERQDYDIINETATLCLRTLRAGMLSGMSSPSRVWFNLGYEQEELNENGEVKVYLEECEDRLRSCFLKSNYYQTLHNSYGEEGLYGTTAFLMMEDAETDIRCHPWPVGSYCVSGDDSLRIDLAQRIYQMTVRQIVQRFGEENCSRQVREWWHSNSGGLKEQWLPIVHTLYRNTYFDARAHGSMEWNSVHYELGSYKTDGKDPGILKRAGFREFPLIVGRWDVVGENFYGEAPAMDCLGTNMGLQRAELRTMQAIDKMVDPPMIGSSALMNQKASILPGDVTFIDDKDGKPGFKPAFQIQYELQWAMKNIDRFEQRIRTALFTDLFLMLSSSDRREITAEEIRAKQEEKMQVLGPVLERNNGEVLAPSIFRALGILKRRGKLPPEPQIVKGKKLKMKFVSILAQAQKLMGVANIERFLATIGNEVAVDQGILDAVDLDEVVRELASDLSIPPKILRKKEDIAKIRADKQKAMREQQQAENAKNLAEGAKNMAAADTGGKNALTDLMPNLSRGGI